jgi:hypothetical protein
MRAMAMKDELRSSLPLRFDLAPNSHRMRSLGGPIFGAGSHPLKVCAFVVCHRLVAEGLIH